MNLSSEQLSYISFRPSPIIQISIPDDEIKEMIKNGVIIDECVGPRISLSGDESDITYIKVVDEPDYVGYYIKVVDDPGYSGYGCCGGIYAEYSNDLQDLKVSKVGYD